MANVPVQELPGDAFLNKYWLDQTLREKMDPLLFFNNKLPITDSTEKTFIYEVIENTATADLENGVMSLPLPGGEEAALTRLNMSNISEVKGRIPKIGYEIPLSRDLLSKTTIQSELELRIGKAAFGMSYYMNQLTLDTLIGGASAGSVSISPTWGSTTGTQDPVKDLINMWYDFKEKEYPNRAYDHFMETVNHQELIQYLSAREIEFNFDDERTVSIPSFPGLRGMRFHDVEDQMTHGTDLIMDLRGGAIYPGAEIYRYIDNEFAVRQANPDQPEENDPTGVHVNIYRETKNPYTTFVELWMHPLPVVKIDEMIKAQTGL